MGTFCDIHGVSWLMVLAITGTKYIGTKALFCRMDILYLVRDNCGCHVDWFDTQNKALDQ